MTLENAIAALKALSIPERRPDANTNELLGLIAEQYVKTTSSKLETSSGTDNDESWWRYVLCCLDCLERLSVSLKEIEDFSPQLSVHQTNLLRERLEFVVALGLSSHLDPGVGLPMASRIFSAEQFLPPRQGFHPERVQLIVERLMALYAIEELRQVLLPKFLHDLLIGLITLSFAPKCEPQVRRHFQTRLRHITTCGNPSRRDVVREVFVIQGAQSDQKSKLATAPSWLRFACSQILSKQIEKSTDGVLPLVLGFFDFVGRQGREAEKCSLIATIIARPPKNLNGQQLAEHWRRIAAQVLSCLLSEADPLLLRFAVAFTDSFTSVHPIEAKELLLNPFFDVGKNSVTKGPLSAEELNLLIIRLERFIINCFDPGELLLSFLLQQFELLFFAFAFVAVIEGPSWRLSVRSTLVALLQLRPPDTSVTEWMALLFEGLEESSRHMQLGPDSQVSVGVGAHGLSSTSRWHVPEENVVAAVVQMLEHLPTDFQALVFIELLRRLRRFVVQHTTELEEVVLATTKRQTNQRSRPDLLMGLLSVVAEKFPECCLERPELIVELAKETISRCLFVSVRCEESATIEFMTEAITTALTLISGVLMSRDALKEGKVAVLSALEDAVPVISDLANSHPSEVLRSLAADLSVALATRGFVTPSSVSGTATRPLVQEMDSAVPEEIHCALRDASNGLIPERGHALLVLARAAEEKRPEVTASGSREQVLQAFIDGVAHEDSYVFLPAVRGLAAVASGQPVRLLPMLLKEFADSRLDAEPGTAGEVRAEFRLKVGEAIVRCVRELGETAIQHRERLLNVLLSRCRIEARPMLRAAAVSNLAEVCRLLRFALHTCLHEVLDAGAALLAGDPATEVRKAAAFLLLSLLRGVDRQAFTILGGDGIREVYRVLRRREAAEQDEGVHRMLLLACNELDDLVRADLFPEPSDNLVKEIRIL